jgi:hypothetical protein
LHVVEFMFVCRFDSHTLPPFFNNLQTDDSLADQFTGASAMQTTFEWVDRTLGLVSESGQQCP